MDKKRILVVEDEESMLNALSDSLNNQEFTIFATRNGIEGLSAALREHPDLILLDIFMPKMDGLVMLRHLRLDVWGRKVPVIILTNLNPNSNSVINSVLKNKPAYYLIKADVKLEGIVDKVKEVLKIEN